MNIMRLFEFILEHYPKLGGVLVLFLGIWYVLVKTKVIKPVSLHFDWLKKKPKVYCRKDLPNHNFFIYLGGLLNSSIRNVNLRDKQRTNVMQCLLKHKLETFIVRMTEYVGDFDDTINNRRAGGELEAFVNTIIDEYEHKFLDEAQNVEERETLQLILDKFNKEHMRAGQAALANLSEIFDSDEELEPIHTKMCSALYTLIIPFTVVFKDVVVTLRKLNGELTGKTFKGKKFEAL